MAPNFQKSKLPPATINENEPLETNTDENNRTSTEQAEHNGGGTDSALSLRSQTATYRIKLGPVKKHMVAGRMMGTVRGMVGLSKKRCVRIQVLSVEETTASGASASGDVEQLDSLGNGDVVYIKFLKKETAKANGANNRDDDESVYEDDGQSVTSQTVNGSNNNDNAEFNKECDSFPVESFQILEVKGRTCSCQLGTGYSRVIREIKFETTPEVESFQRALEKVKRLEDERGQRQLQLFREIQRKKKIKASEKADDVSDDKEIAILGEIVSAKSLPIADIISTDPYVIVQLGTNEIHRTKILSRTLDPIWTLQTGSLFLIRMAPEDFFRNGGMVFVVKDFDQIGANETLGTVRVPLTDILEKVGEREEYSIEPSKQFRKSITKKGSKLNLRFREASEDDIKFMEYFFAHQDECGAYSTETYLPYRYTSVHKTLKRLVKKNEHNDLLYRIRPFPDPDRLEETKWLTEKEILEESLKPSTQWIEAGSGGVGKVFVEILGCDGLPNMDKLTLNPRDKTDAFCCIVFEDCVVNTDVIENCLSPRWMPWTQRAFIFNITHPSSDLIIAAFDYDPEWSPLQIASRATGDLHDAIGRIRIDLSNFAVDMDYTLCYDLFYGETAAQRRDSRGKFWVRIRVQFPDRRKAFLAAAVPPQETFVTVSRAIDFQVAHYTTEGANTDTDFSLTAFAQYIAELQSYEIVVKSLKSAALSLFLWRGHHSIRINGKVVSVPTHSMIAFFWGVLVTWNTDYLPSFFMFSLGWIMVVINQHVNNTPNRWHRVFGFFDALNFLVTGDMRGSRYAETPPNYRLAEIEAFNKAHDDREARIKREIELEKQYDLEMREIYGIAANKGDAEDVDMATTRKTLLKNITDAMNPMMMAIKPILHPIQLQLRQVVIAVRIAKSIVMWHETYYAFWISLACFVLSFAALWVPWSFIIRWTSRLLAWGLLGPWMAFVDRLYFADKPNMTEEERNAIIQHRVRSRYDAIAKAATDHQIRKERAIKQKNMSKYMFGNFTLRVPRFSEDVFLDKPLPASFSKRSDAPKVSIVDRKYGQRLTGDMIPMRQIQQKEHDEAPHRKKNVVFRTVGGTAHLMERSILRTGEHIPLMNRMFKKKAQDADSSQKKTL